jgi:allantoicase
MSNLVNPVPAVFVPDKFTERGKWMDGWETRRRRTPGHDWCVLELGMRGRIRGVDVDTSYFTGNHPSHCSLDGLDATRPVTRTLAGLEGAPWTEVLPRSPTRGDSHNYFEFGDSLGDVARPWGRGSPARLR